MCERALTYIILATLLKRTQSAFTCSKLAIQTLEQGVKYGVTIKIPERRQAVFIVNFEHISHLVLVFVLLTLNM